ncbi:MAG: RNA polymerase sigma factor [Maricaulaceae bacterium]
MAQPDDIEKIEKDESVDGQTSTSAFSDVSKAFVEQQAPLKVFISRLIRRPQDVDDVAQETFVRAFLAERKADIQHPKAYIYRIARNLAFEVLTKKSIKLTSYIEDSCDNSLLQSGEDIESNTIVSEKFDRVKIAIAELPQQCQRVFIMHKVYGFKYKEISQQLGISVSTVEKHIMAGLKKCRQSVKSQETPNTVVDINEMKSEMKGRLK